MGCSSELFHVGTEGLETIGPERGVPIAPTAIASRGQGD